MNLKIPPPFVCHAKSKSIWSMKECNLKIVLQIFLYCNKIGILKIHRISRIILPLVLLIHIFPTKYHDKK